jgi:hypothetical protein
MINNSPTVTDLIDARIIYALADVHTSMPCSVVKYNADKQSVDVQPLIKKEYSNGYVANLPVIQGLPLIFPGSSNSLISFPISVGDIVLAVFSEKSIDKWVRSNGKPVDPSKGLMHDLSDAFAVPGLQTFRTHNNPSTENLEVRFNIGTSNENSVKLKSDGSVEINAPTSVTVNSPSATFTGNVHVDGAISADGEVSSGSIELTTHTHGGVQIGSSSTGEPE